MSYTAFLKDNIAAAVHNNTDYIEDYNYRIF
ncbi:hypothetical protein QUF88_02100 [Bacillus sp. DX1.1]|nr:hypothetical protein [Bacillus sp. DX1.1]MDM5152770.1 hypothetical protein [Bacillus sp. DX1.1]